MMYGWNDGGWGVLWMVLSMAAVVVLVVILIRAITSTDSRRQPRRDPEDVLAARFANGEIDADEYRERVDVLRGSRAQRARR